MVQERQSSLVIVTGASKGIGAAVALGAARLGYTVLVNYAHDRDSAQRIVDSIQVSGGHAELVQADVSDEADVLRLFAAADSTGLPLAALVNNAGIVGGICRLEALTSDMLRRVLDVNVIGSVLCAREAVKRMSTRHGGRGGNIVNISSIAARLGGSGEWVHYAASKGAVETLTVGLAREVAQEGIRVNAVAPGLIETGLHAAAGAPDRLQRLAPGIPMARPGTAEEVAETVLWLMSPVASYITGAIIPVGGGR